MTSCGRGTSAGRPAPRSRCAPALRDESRRRPGVLSAHGHVGANQTSKQKMCARAPRHRVVRLSPLDNDEQLSNALTVWPQCTSEHCAHARRGNCRNARLQAARGHAATRCRVAHTGIAGWGLFANEPVPREGALVIECVYNRPAAARGGHCDAPSSRRRRAVAPHVKPSRQMKP